MNYSVLKVLFKHCLEMKIFPNTTWKELPNTTIYTFSLQFLRTHKSELNLYLAF